MVVEMRISRVKAGTDIRIIGTMNAEICKTWTAMLSTQLAMTRRLFLAAVFNGTAEVNRPPSCLSSNRQGTFSGKTFADEP